MGRRSGWTVVGALACLCVYVGVTPSSSLGQDQDDAFVRAFDEIDLALVKEDWNRFRALSTESLLVAQYSRQYVTDYPSVEARNHAFPPVLFSESQMTKGPASLYAVAQCRIAMTEKPDAETRAIWRRFCNLYRVARKSQNSLEAAIGKKWAAVPEDIGAGIVAEGAPDLECRVRLARRGGGWKADGLIVSAF